MMEIKTKHKKFKTFSDLYQFMCEGHLDEINVTIKYPDKSKNNGTMPIDMVLSLKCIEEVKTIDADLKTIATNRQLDINLAREIAEICNEMNHFDDEDGTLLAQFEEIDAPLEVKEEIQQLVQNRLQSR